MSKGTSSSEDQAYRILARADEVAKRHELLGHRLRTLILASVTALGEASWTDLKALLEAILGPVNPNTLAFHVKKLIDAGLLDRAGSPRSPIYRLAREPEEDIAELAKEMGKMLQSQGKR